MRGIHRWPVNSPHKGPVTRKMFPFDDVIMFLSRCSHNSPETCRPTLVQILAWRHAIIRINFGSLSVWPKRANFSNIWVKIQWFLSRKCIWELRLGHGNQLISALNLFINVLTLGWCCWLSGFCCCIRTGGKCQRLILGCVIKGKPSSSEHIICFEEHFRRICSSENRVRFVISTVWAKWYRVRISIKYGDIVIITRRMSFQRQMCKHKLNDLECTI